MIEEYTDNGLIHTRKFSKNNHKILHYRCSDGYKAWYTYHKNGRLKWFKNSFGDIEEFDSNGNLIHYKGKDLEFWKEFKDNKLIRYRDSIGNKTCYTDLPSTETNSNE